MREARGADETIRERHKSDVIYDFPIQISRLAYLRAFWKKNCYSLVFQGRIYCARDDGIGAYSLNKKKKSCKIGEAIQPSVEGFWGEGLNHPLGLLFFFWHVHVGYTGTKISHSFRPRSSMDC